MRNKRWIEIHEDDSCVYLEFHNGKPAVLCILIDNQDPITVMIIIANWIASGELPKL